MTRRNASASAHSRTKVLSVHASICVKMSFISHAAQVRIDVKIVCTDRAVASYLLES